MKSYATKSRGWYMLSWLLLLAIGVAVAEYHPLDPFTPEEASDCLTFLSSSSPGMPPGPYYNKSSDRVSSMWEQDPPKADVLAWNPSQGPLPRRLLVVIHKPTGIWTGVVTPAQKLVDGWRRVDVVAEGGAAIDFFEFYDAPKIVLQDPEFLQGLSRQGLTPSDVQCVPMSWGGQWNKDFAPQEQNGTRLLHVCCLYTPNTTNPWFQPVPLLSAVVDSDAGTVLKVYDRFDGTPLPTSGNYDDATLAREFSPLPPVHPFVLTQPLGPSYTVSGNRVTWQSWQFHAKPHPRAGVVVSQATFLDPRSKQPRPVLYQVHPSELFVPYQNPDLDFANRDYLDVGEYGFGMLGSTLSTPADCPASTHVFNGTIVNGDGSIIQQPYALCLFERPAAVPAWRHTEVFGSPFVNSRSQVELVLRMVSTVGNYDYYIDFVFRQDASIGVSVTATGVVEVQATADTKVQPGNRFSANPYGTLVSPFHVAVFHSHFFNFRIDLDPDGPSPNLFVREQLTRVRLPADNPVGRKSIWQVMESTVGGELDARLAPNPLTPDVWSFRHSVSTNPSTGNPVGYKLVPGQTAMSLMDPDDPPQKRAMFSTYPLWVSVQDDDQLWASGPFVYQSNGNFSGLEAWTAGNQSLVDQDLVAWYTVGIHHVVRQEDAPVMPTLTQSFDLVPENFYQENPALVIPPDNLIPRRR